MTKRKATASTGADKPAGRPRPPMGDLPWRSSSPDCPPLDSCCCECGSDAHVYWHDAVGGRWRCARCFPQRPGTETFDTHDGRAPQPEREERKLDPVRVASFVREHEWGEPDLWRVADNLHRWAHGGGFANWPQPIEYRAFVQGRDAAIDVLNDEVMRRVSRGEFDVLLVRSVEELAPSGNAEELFLVLFRLRQKGCEVRWIRPSPPPQRPVDPNQFLPATRYV